MSLLLQADPGRGGLELLNLGWGRRLIHCENDFNFGTFDKFQVF
jgi:hypothetical protein